MREINENKIVKFLKDGNALFERACIEAAVKPSHRQASKWLMKKGIAYKIHKGII